MNLQSQYNQAIKIFKDLAPRQSYPSLDTIQAALTDKQRKYIEKHNAQLVITPALSLYDLITQFDKKQSKRTYIYRELWNQYVIGSELRVDFVLPKLLFTNQALQEQIRSLAKLKKSVKGLQSIDPRTYITLNIIRRKIGEALLDVDTFTRFVQYPPKPVDGGSWVGVAHSFGDQLGAGGSNGLAYPRVGVGVSVGLDLNTSDLTLIEPFYSELPDKLTINGREYIAKL